MTYFFWILGICVVVGSVVTALALMHSDTTTTELLERRRAKLHEIDERISTLQPTSSVSMKALDNPTLPRLYAKQAKLLAEIARLELTYHKEELEKVKHDIAEARISSSSADVQRRLPELIMKKSEIEIAISRVGAANQQSSTNSL